MSFLALALVLLVLWGREPQPVVMGDIDTRTVIEFWGVYDLPEVYEPLIEQFERQHPDLNVVYRQFPNQEEYQLVLDTQLQKGKGPDVMLFSSDELLTTQDLLAPRSASDLAEGFAPFVETDLVQRNLIYGLPLWVDTLMLYYNKRYYQDGLAQQWYELGEQTQQISIGGLAMGRLDNLTSGWDMLEALLLQKGIQLSGKGTTGLFDTLEFFNRFAYPIDPFFNWNDTLTRGYEEREVESFARQRVAAIAGYTPLYEYLQLKIRQLDEAGIRHMRGEDLGVAPFPQFDVNQPRHLARYMALGVSQTSEVPEQAWDWIQFLTSETAARYYQQATGRMPGRILAEAPANLSEPASIQRQQLPSAYVYRVTDRDKTQLEPIINLAVKDKRVLRDVLDLSFASR